MSSARGGERREIFVLVACLVTSVLLFAFGGRVNVGWVPRAEVALLWPAEEARRFLEDLTTLRGDNEQLRSEIAQLRQERALLLRAGAENERLRRSLDFAAPRAATLRPAGVLGVFGEPWSLSYQIEGGADRGFKAGAAVVAPEGLIGRITSVGGDESTVALLTDPNLAVASEVIPSGARGTVRFRAQERPALYLDHVPLTDTVRVGDIVVTSAASTLFPAGLPVGFIARLGREPDGLLQEIEVRPAAPLTRLREVFVVIDTKRLGPWQLPPTSEAHAAAPDSARADTARAAAKARAPAASHP